MSTRQYSKLFFWGIIAIGICLPLFFFIPSALDSFIFSPEERFNIISGIFFLLLLTSIPFVVLVVFAKRHLNISQIKNSETIFYKRVWGVMGAVVVIFGFSLYIYFVAATSKSSTACMVFIFLPIYGTAIIPIGYFCGRLIGNLILRFKRS